MSDAAWRRLISVDADKIYNLTDDELRHLASDSREIIDATDRPATVERYLQIGVGTAGAAISLSPQNWVRSGVKSALSKGLDALGITIGSSADFHVYTALEKSEYAKSLQLDVEWVLDDRLRNYPWAGPNDGLAKAYNGIPGDYDVGQGLTLEEARKAARKEAPPECFLSGTLVDMWPLALPLLPYPDGTYDDALILSHVWHKAIEDIAVGDVVVSYDGDGCLKPGRVSRVFRNVATHILDFWGTGVTPGHAYLCGEGVFAGQHVPVMDILRSDGAIVRDDGGLIRAATGCEVGSPGDRMVHVIVGDRQANGQIRVRGGGAYPAGNAGYSWGRAGCVHLRSDRREWWAGH